MPPDSNVESNQATGDKAKEFGRVSGDSSPTKQDLNKYDILYTPESIAIRCIGCMEYLWEQAYSPVEPFIKEFTFEFLFDVIIDHQKICTYWNK